MFPLSKSAMQELKLAVSRRAAAGTIVLILFNFISKSFKMLEVEVKTKQEGTSAWINATFHT